MLKSANSSIKKAALNLGLTLEQLEKLIEVEASHEFEVVLKNGKKFKGYRTQHSSLRGPYKGGIRFHAQVDFDEVRALATLMSLKTALLDLPLGGGKGGVEVDPKQLSIEEVEELSRIYVQKLAEHIGPNKDIPAPDVNTNSQIMDWMVDEYSKLTGDQTKASFTGKSLNNGGSLGRESATGQGGIYVLKTVLKSLEKPISEKTYAIEGFGNVGSFFAKLMSEQLSDWKLVSVSDSSGGVYCKEGLDVKKLLEFKNNKGRFADFSGPGVEHIKSNEVVSTDASVLVLAALGGAVNSSNVSLVKSEIILELANGPVDTDAQLDLASRGVVVVPDILANAGGVVVSYLEWQQNIKGESWSLEQVNSKLQDYITKATELALQKADQEMLDLKDASFLIAVERLVQAQKS